MATRRRSRRKSIAGNITDVQKRLRYLETRPAPTQLASKVVVSKNIAPRAVGQELIADSAIIRRSLAPGVVGNAQIEASAITQSLLATNSVGNDQIQQDSVTNNEIAPGTITSAEMGADSVTSSQIQNGSVGTDELAGGIPDSKISGMSASKLIGEVQNSQIAGIEGSKIIGGIQGSLIVDGTVASAELADNAVTNGKINANAVTNGKIADGAVTGAKIGSLAVAEENIAAFAITTGKISGQAVISTKIGVGAVTNQGLGIDAVLESRIINGAVTADKLRAGSVTGLKIPVGTIENYHLAGGITNGKISSVDAGTIITGTIGSVNRLPGEVLTSISVSNPLTISGSGRSRTIGIGLSGYALSSHTHSGYASSGRYDTSFAGSHVGHGGHTHFTNISSTRKLKKEISDYSIDLDKLFLLQPKRFKYRNQARDASKNREWDYGYIAEEALELGVEEIVGYDEKGEVDSINYGLLSVFVLELVKKQQSEINFLSEEIKRLKESK
jgi:hypothetical protein